MDFEAQLKVPEEVAVTNLRPDMLLVSNSTKQMGIVELTVPSEERIEIAGELKRQKYDKIALDGKKNGWNIRIWAIEVGCKGFPAVSVSTFLKDIGYQGAKRKKTIDTIGKAAEQASHILWKCSFYKNWGRT